MNTQPEIKAGQRWVGIAVSAILTVEWVKGKYLVAQDEGEENNIGIWIVDQFSTNYRLLPEPKTRPITADDIMGMLAEYGVIYHRHKVSGCGKWLIAHAPEYLDEHLEDLEISPNPFAANPVIVGPEIEVGE